MWEHGGCLESVQNVILKCGLLECRTWSMYHTWAS
jgi:hypothetical protein